MTFPAGHVHVTEREGAHLWPDGRPDDAKWEDCLWCVAIEWLRARGYDVPATHAEAEALRADSGEPPTGGSNLDDLRKGALARYGILADELRSVAGATAVWKALTPGTVAILDGNMGNFPAGSHWRRWDPGFADSHSALGARVDDQERVWWCDPLAPKDGSYGGEWMPKADLLTFVGGYSAIVGATGDSTVAIIPTNPRTFGGSLDVLEDGVAALSPAGSLIPLDKGLTGKRVAGRVTLPSMTIAGNWFGGEAVVIGDSLAYVLDNADVEITADPTPAAPAQPSLDEASIRKAQRHLDEQAVLHANGLGD